MLKVRVGFRFALSFWLVIALGCPNEKKPAPPKAAGERYVHDPKMKETLVDVFPGMDGPNLNLTAEDIRGRNVWNLWAGDSYLMWDFLARNGFGTSDLLKTMWDPLESTCRHASLSIL